MPSRSNDDLLRALGRGELAPVYYLFGSEDILKDEAVRSIVDRALEPHERDFNLDLRGAQGMDPEELHALVNTLPMMATRRVVVVRDIEAWRRKPTVQEVLRKYLENPSPETVLLLVEGSVSEDKLKDWEPDAAIIARSYAVDFKPLTPDRIPRWINHHAKRLGVTFGEGAAEHLAVATEYSLGALRSELEKFASLADQGPVSLQQVGELVGIYHGETLEDWVVAVLDGDGAKAVTLARRVLEHSGMSGVKMVSAIGPALIGTRLARSLYDKGTRGPALERALFDRIRTIRLFGIGEWKVVAKNWSRWAETWPAPRLRIALRVALETDAALKNTRITNEEGLILGLTLRLVVRGGGSGSGEQAVGRLGGWAVRREV